MVVRQECFSQNPVFRSKLNRPIPPVNEKNESFLLLPHRNMVVDQLNNVAQDSPRSHRQTGVLFGAIHFAAEHLVVF